MPDTGHQTDVPRDLGADRAELTMHGVDGSARGQHEHIAGGVAHSERPEEGLALLVRRRPVEVDIGQGVKGGHRRARVVVTTRGGTTFWPSRRHASNRIVAPSGSSHTLRTSGGTMTSMLGESRTRRGTPGSDCSAGSG